MNAPHFRPWLRWLLLVLVAWFALQFFLLGTHRRHGTRGARIHLV